ncbi:hypothetical protein DLAC_03247 [Tieghemostelium lacteum]|uniref:Uncharacterized protein n=1 Tax=Tieghemostelium lacteum TaxID=361077 RepID=A0A152A207_TIELA|nr:hypothetical protein DLAC_03247 [Tieghemostelium lacteum]|eukprot:KYR00101.1 hypothetical protein DLAC_03247 [Tieghemostelium lacteum]
MAENNEFPPLGFTVLKRKPTPKPVTNNNSNNSNTTPVTTYSNPFKNNSSNSDSPQYNTDDHNGFDSYLPSPKEIQDNVPLNNSYNLQNIHPFFESQPTIKIMARKQTNTDNKEIKQTKQTKTLEEKELDYQKSRAAIFGTPLPEPSSPTPTSPSGTSSPTTTTPPTYKSGSNGKSKNTSSPTNTIRQPLGPDPSQGSGFNRQKNNNSNGSNVSKK